jgi:protein-L-isoaspartate(D-aspartate) O-methyltransferase
VDSVVEDMSPGQLRDRLATRLTGRNWIRTAPVDAAFRAVPRHLFVPDTVTAVEAYEDTVVATKRGPDGTTLSSVSAPWVQAYALEESGIRSGDRVLEVGSGGYNAALLAELTGPHGHVVTVDIDADITTAARTYLDRTPARRAVRRDHRYRRSGRHPGRLDRATRTRRADRRAPADADPDPLPHSAAPG